MLDTYNKRSQITKLGIIIQKASTLSVTAINVTSKAQLTHAVKPTTKPQWFTGKRLADLNNLTARDRENNMSG